MKIDTHTLEVLDMWISDIGPGLGQTIKDLTKRWQIEGFLPSFIYLFQMMITFELLKNTNMFLRI